MKSLVSVVVITYNSSEFVLETLQSIKSQTYEDLELIISDDASSDNTVEVCLEWIDNNEFRFARTQILKTPNNTGIAANYKRGIVAANGDWIKPIAGDDALLPNCIQDNVDYVVSHPNLKVLYSYNRVYINDFGEENYQGLNPVSFPSNIMSEDLLADEQYKILLTGDRVSFSPTLFISQYALLDAGLPEEDLYSEHYQTLLRLTKKGYKLNFMEKETVLYRKHDKASSNTIKEYILKPHYFKTENFRRRYIYPYIPKDLRMSQKYVWIVNQLFKLESFNEMNRLTIFIFYLLNVVLNPFKYVIYIKSNFIAKYRNDVFYQ